MKRSGFEMILANFEKSKKIKNNILNLEEFYLGQNYKIIGGLESENLFPDYTAKS